MTERSFYFDRAGRPLPVMQWAALFEAAREDRRVAEDMDGDAWISTVWMGIDMSFGHGSPLIFETMVFGGELDEQCWRWPTEAEAEAGHAVVVEQVRQDLHARGGGGR